MTQSNPGDRPGKTRSSSRPRRSSQNRGGSSSRGSRPAREPSGSDRPKGGARRRPEPPKLSGWQQFLKTVTFGLYDPARPEPTPTRETRPAAKERGPVPSKSGDGGKGKRGGKPKPAGDGPLVIEPETPRLYVGNLDYGIDESDLESLFSEAGTVVSASVVRRGGTDRSKGFGFVVMQSVEEAKAAKARLHDRDCKGRPLVVSGAKSEGPEAEGGGNRERSRSRRSRDSEPGEDTGGDDSPKADAEEDRPPRSRSRDRSESGRGERRGGRERGGRERGGGRGSRIDDPEDRGSRTVTPREVEVVTTSTVSIANLSADADEEIFGGLFEGIGQVQAVERPEGSGRAQVTFAEVAEAQRAVELLHLKSFMGETLEVRGVGETVTVTSDAGTE